MPQLTTYHEKNVVLFVAEQSVQGTAVTPVAKDAVACLSLEANIDTQTDSVAYQGDIADREEFTSVIDEVLNVKAQVYLPIIGTIAVPASAPAITDVPLQKLFKAAGATITLSGTSGATAKATISNATVASTFNTLHFRKKPSAAAITTDKTFVGLDARTLVDLEIEIGKMPKLTFNYKANFTPPTEAVALTPDYNVTVAANLRRNIASVTRSKTLITTELTAWTGNTAPTLSNTSNFCFHKLMGTNIFGFELERLLTGCMESFERAAVPADVTVTVLEDAASGAGVREWHSLKSKLFSLQLRFADKSTGWTAGTANRILMPRLQLVDVSDTKIGKSFGQDLKFRLIGTTTIELDAATI